MAITVTSAATAKPDLAIYNEAGWVSASKTTLKAGDTTSLNYYVVNYGAGASQASTTGLYLSTDPTITTSDTRLATGNVAGLSAVNGSHWYEQNSVEIALPSTLAPGTYYLGAIADYGNAVSESDESNNSSTAVAITVTRSTVTYAQKDPKIADTTDYYDFQGGQIVEEHTGGTLSWRNNNPGNILFVGQKAAVGSYHSPNGLTYCIFPSYSDGVSAAVRLLGGSLYAGADLSVDAAMAKWTAATGNTLVNYQSIVDQALHLPGSYLVSNLTQTQLETVVMVGIQHAEGWTVGHFG